MENKMDELINLVKAWIDSQEADGCVGCAFNDRYEWELPCADCKRNHKDYWRRGASDDNE